MKELIDRLQKVARDNQDRFRYQVDVVPKHDGTIRYCFRAFEDAEGHELLSGSGKTIEEAVVNAKEDLSEAVESWGYKL